ncbi:MAG: hypothetical protein HQK49_17265 [Oligoflexia bacterium]|nr:hypothetical protein [Oligoflexia bacterium]
MKLVKPINDLRSKKKHSKPKHSINVRRVDISSLTQRDYIFINSLEGVEKATKEILLMDVTAIGVDTEFQYTKYFLGKKKKGDAYGTGDIKTIVPLLLSLAVVTKGAIIPYVIDLRVRGICPWIQKLMNCGHRLVFHYVKAEVFCLKILGVEIPDINIFDTHLAQLFLNLGHYHHRYIEENPNSDEDEENNRNKMEEKKEFATSLVSVCKKYGVEHKYMLKKKHIQYSFLQIKPNAQFTQEQLDYSAKDAISTVQIYFYLIEDLIKNDLLYHMETVEFPYAIPNAECEWNGFKVSKDKCSLALKGLLAAVELKVEYFRMLKVKNPRSGLEIKNLFRKKKILDYFRYSKNKSGYSFASAMLKSNRGRHLIIENLYIYKKYISKTTSKIFTDEYVSIDGCIHPNWIQGGAETGRTTSRNPAATSIGKIFRPIVVPEKNDDLFESNSTKEENDLFECDLSQIEMGVAAALSGDLKLIEDYNKSDVYVNVAKRFFKSKLSDKQLNYTDEEFKDDPYTSKMRDIIKKFCLSAIYNVSAYGVAGQLGISEIEAQRELDRFFREYRTLKEYLEELPLTGKNRGYSLSITGMKRFRNKTGPLTNWENNWMRNAPIQSSAADLFKLCVIRLNRILKKYSAKIILQIYDSVVIEVKNEYFDLVSELVKRTMEATVEELFPCLVGKADLNNKHPFCWSKDEKFNSIEEFIKNPEYKP